MERTETGLVAGFVFFPEEDCWHWSAEASHLHDRMRTTRTSTAEMLAHVHPDDRESVRALLDRLPTEGSLGSRHRVVLADGRVREMAFVAQLFETAGAPAQVEGFYIDVTDGVERAHQRSVSQAMTDLADDRAAIEQAKGVLMLVYRVPAAQAFDVLRWLSQRSQTKVRSIAEQLMARIGCLPADAPVTRDRFDRLLLTLGAAHP